MVKSESDLTLVGVLSKKDLSKSGKVVSDIWSSPPVAARGENKVADAACLMLKHKVSRDGNFPLPAIVCFCKGLRTPRLDNVSVIR